MLSPGPYVVNLKDESLDVNIPVEVYAGNETTLSVSVYGTTVALIGTERQLERATHAVELLLHGSEHSTVFHLLARQRRDDARDDATATAEPEAEEP